MVLHVEHLAHDVGGEQGDTHIDEIVANQYGSQQCLRLLAKLDDEFALAVVARLQVVDVGRL